MTPEELKLFNDAIHRLTSASQMWHSYEQLSENLNFKIQPKKIQEMCRKSALICSEIRQAVLCCIKTEE